MKCNWEKAVSIPLFFLTQSDGLMFAFGTSSAVNVTAVSFQVWTYRKISGLALLCWYTSLCLGIYAVCGVCITVSILTASVWAFLDCVCLVVLWCPIFVQEYASSIKLCMCGNELSFTGLTRRNIWLFLQAVYKLKHRCEYKCVPCRLLLSPPWM